MMHLIEQGMLLLPILPIQPCGQRIINGGISMDCIICKNGKTKAGVVNVVLQRDVSTIIIKNVPADICENCGEYYLNETITGKVLERAEEAVQKGAEVEILRFAA